MSKTVKRVSNTVKTVMTVTIIGLVAMLGAEAEAHTRIINGKPRVCSVCDDSAEVKEVPAHFFGVAELIVKTQKTVTILCPKEAPKEEVQVKTELTLVGVTDFFGSLKGETTAKVPFVVSGQILGFCGVDEKGNEILSLDVEIPKMSLTYNAYQCTGSCDDPRSTKVLVSSLRLDCKLPRDADFDDMPSYDCEKPKDEEHVF